MSIEQVENLESETVETPNEEAKTEGLSAREAMAKAISENSSEEGEPKPAQEAPTQKEVRAAVDADPEPPSEFSAKGKDAWKKKDIRGIQEEYSRINTSRVQEISRAQAAERAAREEAKPIKELVEKVRNYLSLRGDDDTADEVKIAQALQLVSTLKKKDGAEVKAGLLEYGIDLDAKTPQNNSEESSFSALQDRLAALERDKEEQIFNQTKQTFAQSFAKLASLKTRTGDVVFPDLLDESEDGKQLGYEIGSLTKDPQFQARILRRFPDADFTVLVREAYKARGGRVSGEPVSVSPKQTQQHIDKSRRASASTPGRVVSKSGNDSLIGKLSNRAAMKKAIEQEAEH